MQRASVEEALVLEPGCTLAVEASSEVAYSAGEGDALLAVQVVGADAAVEVEEEEELSEVPNLYLFARMGRPIQLREEQRRLGEELKMGHPTQPLKQGEEREMAHPIQPWQQEDDLQMVPPSQLS